VKVARAIGGAAACAVTLACAGAAHAHQASATYATLSRGSDPASARYEIRIASRDLYEVIGLESDRDATDAEIEAGRARLIDHVNHHVAFEADGAPCRETAVSADVVHDGGRFARVAIDVLCPAPIHELALEYDLFFDIDPQHVGYVRVDGSAVAAQLTAPDDTRLVWRVGGEPPGGLLDFVVAGVHHILEGLDHILFLLSLLLVAVVGRRGRASLLYTVGIVSSFTVAHSMTLIAAALGWIQLPSRLVESVIAASIVLVAVENAIRPDPPHRRVITFVFGLMHGLGFAAMLRPLLPPGDVVLPLLAFNVGVEIGQLGIVVVALPLLHGAARALGAGRYRRAVLPAGAIVFGGLGAIWLVERAFDIRILGL
jgi:hydrogenase/urease accessory protein HupE